MTPSTAHPFIKWFADITIDDVPLVGGKNASLGEMVRELASKGVKVPDGFAITAEAFRHFIRIKMPRIKMPGIPSSVCRSGSCVRPGCDTGMDGALTAALRCLHRS